MPFLLSVKLPAACQYHFFFLWVKQFGYLISFLLQSEKQLGGIGLEKQRAGKRLSSLFLLLHTSTTPHSFKKGNPLGKKICRITCKVRHFKFYFKRAHLSFTTLLSQLLILFLNLNFYFYSIKESEIEK